MNNRAVALSKAGASACRGNEGEGDRSILASATKQNVAAATGILAADIGYAIIPLTHLQHP